MKPPTDDPDALVYALVRAFTLFLLDKPTLDADAVDILSEAINHVYQDSSNALAHNILLRVLERFYFEVITEVKNV